MSANITGIVPRSFAVRQKESSIDLPSSLEQSRKVPSIRFRSVVVRSLVLSIATAILAPAWGCGESAQPQIASDDEEATAKAQAAFASMKAARAKKRLPDVPARTKPKPRPSGL